jgi:hypothetical protein
VAGSESKIDILDVEDFGMPQVEPVQGVAVDLMDWEIPAQIPGADAMGDDASVLVEAAAMVAHIPPIAAGFTGRATNYELPDISLSEMGDVSVAPAEPAPDAATEPDMIQSVVRLELDDGFCPVPSPAPTPEEDVAAAYGYMVVNGTQTTTITTAGTPEKATDLTVLPAGTNLLFDDDGGVDNRLKYVGAVTRKFKFEITATVLRVAGTDPQEVQVILAKGGVELGSTEGRRTRARLDGAIADECSLTGIIELAQNEYLEIFFDVVGNGDQVSLEDGQFSIFSLN